MKYYKTLVPIVLVALGGCAVLPEQNGKDLDNTAAVAKIAQGRWDALVKRDFDAAYKLNSPGARSLQRLDEFSRKAGMVIWLSARVVKVECSEVDLCGAQVEAVYSYQTKIGGRLENKQVLTETWRQVEGAWWYVPPVP